MLVYEFDELKQTGLIWAAKRDYTVLAERLVHARSRISFKDLLGRNALMLAVVNGNERLIRFLLCFNANPITRNNKGQAAIHMTDDQTIISMMQRVATGRAVVDSPSQVLNVFVRLKRYSEIWKFYAQAVIGTCDKC